MAEVDLLIISDTSDNRNKIEKWVNQIKRTIGSNDVIEKPFLVKDIALSADCEVLSSIKWRKMLCLVSEENYEATGKEVVETWMKSRSPQKYLSDDFICVIIGDQIQNETGVEINDPDRAILSSDRNTVRVTSLDQIEHWWPETLKMLFEEDDGRYGLNEYFINNGSEHNDATSMLCATIEATMGKFDTVKKGTLSGSRIALLVQNVYDNETADKFYKEAEQAGTSPCVIIAGDIPDKNKQHNVFGKDDVLGLVLVTLMESLLLFHTNLFDAMLKRNIQNSFVRTVCKCLIALMAFTLNIPIMFMCVFALRVPVFGPIIFMLLIAKGTNGLPRICVFAFLMYLFGVIYSVRLANSIIFPFYIFGWLVVMDAIMTYKFNCGYGVFEFPFTIFNVGKPLRYFLAKVNMSKGYLNLVVMGIIVLTNIAFSIMEFGFLNVFTVFIGGAILCFITYWSHRLHLYGCYMDGEPVTGEYMEAHPEFEYCI